MSDLEITPAPSDEEGAAIVAALQAVQTPEPPIVQSRWKTSGRQYDEDLEAFRR